MTEAASQIISAPCFQGADSLFLFEKYFFLYYVIDNIHKCRGDNVADVVLHNIARDSRQNILEKTVDKEFDEKGHYRKRIVSCKSFNILNVRTENPDSVQVVIKERGNNPADNKSGIKEFFKRSSPESGRNDSVSCKYKFLKKRQNYNLKQEGKKRRGDTFEKS